MVVYADPYPKDTTIVDEMYQYDLSKIIPQDSKSTLLQKLITMNKESFVNLGIVEENNQLLISYSIITLIIVVLILLLVLTMVRNK